MINIKYKNIGKTTKLFCKKCENIAHMELIYIYHSFDVASFSVAKRNKELLAVCPFCGEIKKVILSPSQLKLRKMDNLYIIKPDELKQR